MLLTKYSFLVPIEEVNKEVKRLTNQLWKLIPMREHEEDWQKQLDTVILEIAGLNEIFISASFIQLLSKLEGLKIVDTELFCLSMSFIQLQEPVRLTVLWMPVIC